MVRGRKASPDSARENLHIRVQKEDLLKIRETVSVIRGLLNDMRELGITDLPPRTVGGLVSKSLTVYADLLEQKYRRRPVVFLTNGFETRIIDGQYPERKCAFIYSKRDLEK